MSASVSGENSASRRIVVPMPGFGLRFAVLSRLKSLQKQLVAAKRKNVAQCVRDQCCRSRVFNKHGRRRTVQRCNGFEHYRRSRLLAKARRGGARSGRANGGGPHQVAHAWDRGKLRKDSQMGRATSRRIALSETRDHGPERNYY